MTTKEEVAEAIRSACEAYLESRDWDDYDLGESLRDLWHLHKHEDCCYDRVSIGMSYALWYHARRTHEALRLLQPSLDSYAEGGPLEILDLGAGTGATAWALALARRMNPDLPPMRVVGIDG